VSDSRTIHSRSALRHLPLALIASAALLGAIFLRDVLDFDALAANREALIAFRDANYAATLAVFAAAYVAVVAFSLPGGLIATLTGGFLFGLWPGVLINVAAATAGAALIFLAARAGLGQRLARRMDASDGFIRRLKAGIDANQWEMLLLIRLIPAVPFFMANLLPALLSVPLHRYIVTTFLGIIPGAAVYTSVGAGLGQVFAAGETPDLGLIFEPHVLLPLLGLAALAALPMVVRAVRGRVL